MKDPVFEAEGLTYKSLGQRPRLLYNGTFPIDQFLFQKKVNKIILLSFASKNTSERQLLIREGIVIGHGEEFEYRASKNRIGDQAFSSGSPDRSLQYLSAQKMGGEY